MIKRTAAGLFLLVAAAGAAPSANAAEPEPARAVQDLYHWFTTDDYPLEALVRRGQGVVRFRLTIDAQGAVSNCVIESSSGDPDLDRVSCEVLRSRARYHPARDAEGRPVEGSDSGSVTWRLPAMLPEAEVDGAPRPVQRARANLSLYFTSDDFPEPARLRGIEGTVGFRLAISAEGRVTGCTVTHASGDSSLDEATCAILIERARYAPARDAQQRAVADTDFGRVTWRFPPGFEAASLETRRVVTRMRRVAGGDVRCTVVLNGALVPGETRGECGDLAGIGAGDWLRAPGGPAEIVMVFATGRPEAGVEGPGADEVNYGQMGLEAITSLSIAPDGRIGDCRTVRMTRSPALALDDFVPCDLEGPERDPYFEPSTEVAARRVRMRTAIFFK
jgi:TonB family protein